MCSTIYFIYISNRFVKNYKFFPPYIKRIEISNTVCILCLILQIKNKIVLATRILFFYCFFCVSRFTWYLQAYWIMPNWLNWFWKPTELYFFCEFCHLLLNPTSFNLHLYFFLQVFFLLIFLTDMKCRWFSLKKKWQDNGFFCIRSLFCNVTFYWYKSLYYYILLYICKK